MRKISFGMVVIVFCTRLGAQEIQYNKEFHINSYTDSYETSPTICGLSNGGFVVCWYVTQPAVGPSHSIYGQIYDSYGQKIGEEFLVNSLSNGWQDQPAVCGLVDGGFAVCWVSYDQNDVDGGIYGQIFNSDGTKRGMEFHVNTFTSNGQYSSDICALVDSGFVVCWESFDQDGDRHGIFGQIYDQKGSKKGQEFQVNKYSYLDQYQPCISGLSDGGFVVSWSSAEQDGDDYGIFSQIYNRNGTIRVEEFLVNTYTNFCQYSPSVSNISANGFIICWASDGQDGDDYGVFGQMFDNNGMRISQEFQINTYTPMKQFDPQVAGFSNGGFFVCWQSIDWDNNINDIFGQLYDDIGIKIGQEFQINTFSSLFPERQSLSTLYNDDFIVCWQSAYPGFYEWEILGKYYLGYPILHSLTSYSLISPALDNTLYSTTINFEWEHATSVYLNFPWELEYSLYIDETEEFHDPMIFSEIYDTTFTVKDLSLGQTYFWKVLVKNIDGDSLWSSETFGFYVDPAASIEDDATLKPEAFALYPNYPNPFNPSTVIRYRLSAVGDVELSIYNVLGEKVVTLVSGVQHAGYHTIEWDASGITSGVYIVTLVAGNFKASQKMLLVK